MGDGIRMLSQNSYIKDLGALVLGYGMAINICEVTWKAGLKKAFPNPNDYSAFMGNFSSVTGVATLVMMFVGKFMLSRFGWRPAALVTPIVVLVSGLGFFGLLMYSTAITAAGSAGATICGFAPLTLAVFIGAAQNIFSKSAKYSLFDPCKEMAYIPLDDETRLRGKAAIDVVAARGGKSGGAFIQQLLIIAFGSLSASTPVLALLLLLVCGQWIKSTLSLASQFQDMERDDTASKLMPAKARPACSAWAPPPVGFETWTRYRYVAVVDDETGNIKTSYVPYTEFPADYLERITSDTAVPVQSLTS